MGNRGTRTFICTVVFIDIVEYSKKSVAEQMRVKQKMNELLENAIRDVPGKDRIILDTGDGAAVNFLGEPEEGLFLGLALREAVIAAADDSLRLRIGINLGPVRMVRDINNQPNIIGDGINVAQRVMGFADVNQVLASRSYYEVISTLSADYAKLFSFQGSRTDKHVREHEVYALGNAPAPPRAPRRKAAHAAAFEKLGHTASTARVGLMRRPLLTTALTVVLILTSAVALRMNLRGKPAPEPAPVAVEIPAEQGLPPLAAAPQEPKAAPAAKTEPAPRTGFFRKTPAETRPPAPPPPVEVATGTVRLIVLPWGEVHIDGQRYGVAPPLRDIALKPGPHRIEVRNPGFASYVQVVEVEADKEIRIRHRFR